MHITYQIDDSHRIVMVGGDWDEFAESNKAPELVGNSVIGRYLWDFIGDPTTCELYRDLITLARRGKMSQFRIRCDGPDITRLITLRIRAVDDHRVEFVTDLLRSETRDARSLLDRDATRNGDLLHSCSWCSRIRVGNTEWIDLDAAIERLNLFHAADLPHLSHGLCQSCDEQIRRRSGLSTLPELETENG
jgi:hypothetical protein